MVQEANTQAETGSIELHHALLSSTAIGLLIPPRLVDEAIPEFLLLSGQGVRQHEGLAGLAGAVDEAE
jgi:hypothetical protein